MLLAQLGWEMPPQPPPRITQKGQLQMEWIWCRPFRLPCHFPGVFSFAPSSSESRARVAVRALKKWGLT